MLKSLCVGATLLTCPFLWVPAVLLWWLQARLAIPTEPLMWITAAKLEEAQGNVDNIDNIITRAMKALNKEKVREAGGGALVRERTSSCGPL
jgi:hypothetical protein